MAQPSVDEEDVECSLVVGDKDVGFACFYVVSAADFDWEQEDAAYEARPEAGRVVAPEVAVSDNAAQ